MRNLLIIFTFIFCNILSAIDNRSYIHVKNHGARETALFIFHAKKGLIQIDEGNDKKGKLILLDINNSITFFSERPNRHSGTLSVDKFLESWKKGVNNFQSNPPSAGLTYYSKQKDTKEKYTEVAVILKNPNYDQSSDRLTFDIDFIKTPDETLPKSYLDEVTLFIDGYWLGNLIKQ